MANDYSLPAFAKASCVERLNIRIVSRSKWNQPFDGENRKGIFFDALENKGEEAN